jgi:serine/threonine-protein kinase HipA
LKPPAGRRVLASVNSGRRAQLQTHSQCGRFLLTQSEAREIISEVKDIASTWRDEFRDAGIAPRDIHTLAGCFSVADEADRQQIQVNTVLGHDRHEDLNEPP